MSGGWNTIESDAGVFTYVLDGLGAKDLQFEELVALDSTFLEQLSPVYGVIFLFKYLSGEKPGGEPLDGTFDHEAAENIFFAQQTIQNACGTQALLSVLLNQDTSVKIGASLEEFKDFTAAFPSELRGECLSNSELIRTVHNSFARSSPFVDETTRQATDEDDVYHFIAYVPINGTLYELDGLNPAPISHGPSTFAQFPEKLIPVLQRRIQRYPTNEIRFNLLAMTRDLRIKAREVGDFEMLQQEERKRREWQWENALRRHNFVGFVGELGKAVVGAKLKEGNGAYEGWVEDAKRKTEARIGEGRGKGTNDYFPYFDKSETVQWARQTGRHSFVLEYVLDLNNQSLSFGPESSVNITPPAILPFLSEPFEVHTKTGDQDGINLPWFSHADATLLFGQFDVSGQDRAHLSLRMRWTEKARFEIWPDSQTWDFNDPDSFRLEPLLSLENYNLVDHAYFRAILPTGKISSSPSQTYNLRCMILKVLNPTFLALSVIVSIISAITTVLWNVISFIAQLFIIYVAIFLILWLAKGRPPLSTYLANVPLVQFIQNHQGSHSNQSGDSGLAEETNLELESPRPLHNMSAFFKSKSPLDDLFVTFSSTKWLLRPLRGDRSRDLHDVFEDVEGKAGCDVEDGGRMMHTSEEKEDHIDEK